MPRPRMSILTTEEVRLGAAMRYLHPPREHSADGHTPLELALSAAEALTVFNQQSSAALTVEEFGHARQMNAVRCATTHVALKLQSTTEHSRTRAAAWSWSWS